jgi:hypothetical protein
MLPSDSGKASVPHSGQKIVPRSDVSAVPFLPLSPTDKQIRKPAEQTPNRHSVERFFSPLYFTRSTLWAAHAHLLGLASRTRS